MKAGWGDKKLGELSFVASGGTPLKSTAEFWGGDIPWYSSGELNGETTIEPKDKITALGLERSNAKLFPKGSLLIGMYDTAAMKMALLDRDAAFNQAVAGIKPTQQVDLRYVKAALEALKPSIMEQRRGTRQKNLSLKKIKDIEIPLPPLEEQRRIVAVLDAAFEGLARARAHTEANLQNARELFVGTIASEFSKIPPFQKRKVGEVAVHSLGKMLDKNKNKGAPQAYLRNLNVRWFNVDTSDLLEMRFTNSEVERYTVKKGDLLICEGGYPGRSSIWEEDYEIYFQKALHRVRFECQVYGRLLMYFLYMSDQSGELREHFSGTGIQHFTGKALARFEMPFPSLKVADEIVLNIEAMQRRTLEVECHFQRKLQDLDDLRQSLLQKAFAGELT